MKEPIDLGQKNNGPLSTSDYKSSEVYYPEFHFSTEEEEVEIPCCGTMTIQFRRKRSTETMNEEGEESCSYDICVEKILSVKGEKDERPSKRDTSSEDALDSLAKKLVALHDELEEGDE